MHNADAYICMCVRVAHTVHQRCGVVALKKGHVAAYILLACTVHPVLIAIDAWRLTGAGHWLLVAPHAVGDPQSRRGQAQLLGDALQTFVCWCVQHIHHHKKFTSSSTQRAIMLITREG